MSALKIGGRLIDVGRDASAGDGYDIGYRKPPVRSRFPTGKSGNRGGRARGKGKAGKSLKAILFETISVRHGDKSTKSSRYEVVMRRLVTKALKGDWRLGLKILQLVPYPELQKTLVKSGNTKPVLKEEAAEAYGQLMEGLRL